MVLYLSNQLDWASFPCPKMAFFLYIAVLGEGFKGLEVGKRKRKKRKKEEKQSRGTTESQS